MKLINRAAFSLLSVGVLSLSLSACAPHELARVWQVSSPKVNEAWKGNNGQIQWHPHTGKQTLASVGTQCFFCGEGVDSDGDGVLDNRDECANTPKGVKVYWQAEHFGRTETPIGRPGCPVDSDLDGVPDYLDSCPNTAWNVKVDGKGCPLDSDGDRVYDDVDKCPNTRHGAAVDDAGCPLDTDGDGVLNDADKCPNTPIGAQVNRQGCWVLEHLNFATGSDKIMPWAFPALNRAVDVLADNPKIRIEIQGHTDEVGSDDLNLKLSMKRAIAVESYMVARGIAANRLTVNGFGKSQPIAKGSDPTSREQNRRVVLKPLE
ncbi:MAG: OmpA family protein [Magnetococcales bacterium]|nr:OmpA family protein [Magnetococcales bacterium]MBF0438869.1 OmpA family protein [Magnetococcales bacterium]